MFSLSFELVKSNFTTVASLEKILWTPPGKIYYCSPGKILPTPMFMVQAEQYQVNGELIQRSSGKFFNLKKYALNVFSASNF